MKVKIPDHRAPIVLQFSGGMDSTVLLTFLLSCGKTFNIRPIYFDVGKKRQLLVAEYLADKLKVPLAVVPISSVYKALTRPKENYIPGYKAIMNVITLAFADSIDAWEIYVAYEDQAEEEEEAAKAFGGFLKAGDKDFEDHQSWQPFREELASLYTKFNPKNVKRANYFSFIAPFLGLSKTNILGLGRSLRAPIFETLSCQNSDSLKDKNIFVHCGDQFCYFCNERKKAFQYLNMRDSTNYYY